MKKIFLTLTLFLALVSQAFADTASTHYSLIKPTVGGSPGVWGSKLNANADTLDSALWSISAGVNKGVNSSLSNSTNLTLTNPVVSTQLIGFTTTGKKLVLPAMNAATSPQVGAVIHVINGASETFDIVANDGTTSVASSLLAGKDIYLTVTSNATANGTFRTNTYGDLSSSIAAATYAPINNATMTGTTTVGALAATTATIGTLSSTSLLATLATISTLSAPSLLATSATLGSATATSANIVSLLAASATFSSSVSFPSNSTAATQSAGDASTKIATTAYVDRGSSGASMVLLGTATASSSVSIVFTDIPAGYDEYVLSVDHALPAVAGNLVLQFSTNNGSSFLGTGNYYADYVVSSAGAGAVVANNTSSLLLAGAGTVGGVSGVVHMFGLDKVGIPSETSHFHGWDGSNYKTTFGGGSNNAASAAVNAIGVYFPSSNIVSGKFNFYGIRNH